MVVCRRVFNRNEIATWFDRLTMSGCAPRNDRWGVGAPRNDSRPVWFDKVGTRERLPCPTTHRDGVGRPATGYPAGRQRPINAQSLRPSSHKKSPSPTGRGVGVRATPGALHLPQVSRSFTTASYSGKAALISSTSDLTRLACIMLKMPVMSSLRNPTKSAGTELETIKKGAVLL